MVDVVGVAANRVVYGLGLNLIAISRLIVIIVIHFEIDIIGAYIGRHFWQTIVRQLMRRSHCTRNNIISLTPIQCGLIYVSTDVCKTTLLSIGKVSQHWKQIILDFRYFIRYET